MPFPPTLLLLLLSCTCCWSAIYTAREAKARMDEARSRSPMDVLVHKVTEAVRNTDPTAQCDSRALFLTQKYSCAKVTLDPGSMWNWAKNLERELGNHGYSVTRIVTERTLVECDCARGGRQASVCNQPCYEEPHVHLCWDS